MAEALPTSFPSRGSAERARLRARSLTLPLLVLTVPWQVWTRNSFLPGPSEETPAKAAEVGGTSPERSDDEANILQDASLLPLSLKLAVFDLAGTTLDDDVDGQPLAVAAIRAAFTAAGMDVDEDSVTAVRGLEKKEAIRRLCRQFSHQLGGKPPDEEELVDRVHGLFREALDEGLRTAPLKEVPGTSAVFAALKARGTQVVIASGFAKEVVEELVRRLGWKVDGLVSAKRPRPDSIFEAMAMTGVENVRQVVKVGDTVADIEEGKNAGVFTVAVLTGTQGEAKLRAAQPHFVLDSVASLVHILPDLTDEEPRATSAAALRGSEN